MGEMPIIHRLRQGWSIALTAATITASAEVRPEAPKAAALDTDRLAIPASAIKATLPNYSKEDPLAEMKRNINESPEMKNTQRVVLGAVKAKSDQFYIVLSSDKDGNNPRLSQWDPDSKKFRDPPNPRIEQANSGLKSARDFDSTVSPVDGLLDISVSRKNGGPLFLVNETDGRIMGGDYGTLSNPKGKAVLDTGTVMGIEVGNLPKGVAVLPITPFDRMESDTIAKLIVGKNVYPVNDKTQSIKVSELKDGAFEVTVTDKSVNGKPPLVEKHKIPYEQ